MVSTDDLLNLTNIGQRTSNIRFDLLDLSLSKVDEIVPEQGPVPVVENNINRTIKRTISGLQFDPREQAKINGFGGRIRPVWILENGVEFNCGVFLFGSIERIRWEFGLDANVTGVDQMIILDQPVETGVGYPAGTAVRTAIQDQFTQGLIPDFSVSSDINTVIANPIAWPAGTTRREIINNLAAMGGANSAFFDRNGIARVIRVTENENTELIYNDGGRIYEGSVVESDSLLDSPNRWIVIDSSNPEFPISGSYTIPSSASNSIENRGYVVANVIDAQGLENNAQAAARARSAANQSGNAYEWIQFSGPPDPRHETFDTVLFRGNLYREQSWRLPLLEGSEMEHDLRRTFEIG